MKMVKSAYRALDVLELLASRPSGLSFTEILKETGLAKSTAHELMQTLLGRKYVNYQPTTRLYFIGARVLTLGVEYIRYSPDMRRAAELVRQLAAYPGATVCVGVLSGERVVIVQEEGREGRSEPERRGVGAELPLASALGKAMLCLRSEEEELRSVRSAGSKDSRPAGSEGERREWRWEMREVRAFGFAFAVEPKGKGGYSLAVPVCNDSGEISVAVSVELSASQTEYAQLKEIAYWLYEWSHVHNPLLQAERLQRDMAGPDGASPVYVTLPNFHSQKALVYLHTFEQSFREQSLPWMLANGCDDEWKQQLFLELAIDKLRPRCIVVSPVNAVRSDPLFRAASQAGIPAICFQRPSRSRFVEYYVGGDGYEQGVMQMEYVAERLKGRGQVLLLEGDPYNDNARNMSFGHQAVLERYSSDRLYAMSVPVMLWSKEESRQIVAELLTAGAKFDAIVAGSDDMAEGVITELARWNLTGKVFVVGGDGDASAVRLIKARQQHATVFQRPAEAARAAVRVASALAAGTEAPGLERRQLLHDFPGKEVRMATIPYLFYDASNIKELEAYWTKKDRFETVAAKGDGSDDSSGALRL